MTRELSASSTVDDPRVARALLDVRNARLLGAFLDGPRTIGEVARELGEDFEAVRYRVRRLAELGVLNSAGARARHGRPMPLYRAASEAFFVPFEVTPYETLEAYLEGVERDVSAWLRRNVALALDPGRTWGLRIARGEDGHVHSKLARTPGADEAVTPDGPAVLSFVYPQLRLDFAQAKAMQAELLGVFRRYAEQSGAQTYACQLVLCPVLVPMDGF